MYRCSASKFHLTVSGRPMDEEHFCEEGSLNLAVQKHIRLTRSFANNLTWQCPSCSTTMTGELACMACPANTGRGSVLNSTLNWFAANLANLEEPTVPSKTLSLETLTNTVLSPHGIHLSGLLLGAYSTSEIPPNATCSCSREAGQGLDWQSSEPPEACPGLARGRKDGFGVPGLNVLPNTRVTQQMVDGPEVARQRKLDTRKGHDEGIEVAAHTNGTMFSTTVAREPVLARLPLMAPPPNLPPLCLAPPTPTPPTRTRSLSPERISLDLPPRLLRRLEGRGRGGDQLLTITRRRADWSRFDAMLADMEQGSRDQTGHINRSRPTVTTTNYGDDITVRREVTVTLDSSVEEVSGEEEEVTVLAPPPSPRGRATRPPA